MVTLVVAFEVCSGSLLGPLEVGSDVLTVDRPDQAAGCRGRHRFRRSSNCLGVDLMTLAVHVYAIMSSKRGRRRQRPSNADSSRGGTREGYTNMHHTALPAAVLTTLETVCVAEDLSLR